MTWQDRISDVVFTITTGDGKVYTPLWKQDETSKEFNFSGYEFIKLPGAFIDRREVKARQFPLVFWFQGANNIDTAQAFDLSANDKRPWKVKHPFYGDISGHPTKMGRDDKSFNITQFSVDFIESLVLTDVPTKTVYLPDELSASYTNLVSIAPVDYASKVQPTTKDLNTMRDNASVIDKNIQKVLDNSFYAEYTAAKSEMFAAIDQLLFAPVNAVTSILNLERIPAEFALSVAVRIDLFKAIFGSIKNVLFLGNTPNNKAYFESAGAGCIGSLANALVNPLASDYQVRSDVVNASAELAAMYSDYLAKMDAGYVAIGNTGSSFSGSAETQNALYDLVVETLSSLEAFALDAKQEREVTLDKDSNLLLLTHRYVGLDADDENIQTFRTINNIRLRELFNVRKGRVIKYYV